MTPADFRAQRKSLGYTVEDELRAAKELLERHGYRVIRSNFRPQVMEARFWAKVDKTGSCWVWTAAKDRKGYGLFKLAHKQACQAHRVAWQIANGAIPTDGVVMHRCDNPSCVNPAHLEMGTAPANNADKVAKGRQAKGASLINNAKLTATVVRAIRASEASHRQLARKHDVSEAAIRMARRGITWSHVE